MEKYSFSATELMDERFSANLPAVSDILIGKQMTNSWGKPFTSDDILRLYIKKFFKDVHIITDILEVDQISLDLVASQRLVIKWSINRFSSVDS